MSHQDFEAGYEAGRSEGWEEGFAAKNLDNIPACEEKPESDLCRVHTCETCGRKPIDPHTHDGFCYWCKWRPYYFTGLSDNWTPR